MRPEFWFWFIFAVVASMVVGGLQFTSYRWRAGRKHNKFGRIVGYLQFATLTWPFWVVAIFCLAVFCSWVWHHLI